MRSFLLISALILCALSAVAQIYPRTEKQVFFYTSAGFLVGSPAGARISLATIFRSHHEISVGYNFYSKKARAIPGDYIQSQGWNFGLAAYPQDELSGATFTYGYVIYPRSHPKLRYVLRAGVLSGTLTTPDQFTPSAGAFNLLGPRNPPPSPGYYSFSRPDHKAYAFIVQPSMDYSPARAFGLSLGLYGIISNSMNGGGVTASMLFGKVSNNRKAVPRHIYEMRRKRNFRKAKQWAYQAPDSLPTGRSGI